MISDLSVTSWLACGYALSLIGVAYAIDALARRSSRYSESAVSAGFTYHADHDAWLCPQDQWLWPQSFDPVHRVMRYRGTPSVCNACPVASTCTTSRSGREVVRAVDQWPASEAARFHRGIACVVAVIGVIWAFAAAFMAQEPTEAALLVAVSVVAFVAALPLFGHLRRSPAAFPEQVAIRTLDDSLAVRERVAVGEERRRHRYRSAARSRRRDR